MYGLGVRGLDCPVSKNNKHLKEYKLWTSMLLRCTENLWSKCHTYTGVTCSDNFKDYSFFFEWCHRQVGFGNKDSFGRHWQLDKDLLVKGNKVYSENICVFIPQRINALLVKCNTARGKYPVGVYLNKVSGKFQAYCRDSESKRLHLGSFTTPQEAFQAYKVFKESLVKKVAEDYKNLIDNRVYQALMNYEVNEND